MKVPHTRWKLNEEYSSSVFSTGLHSIYLAARSSWSMEGSKIEDFAELKEDVSMTCPDTTPPKKTELS